MNNPLSIGPGIKNKFLDEDSKIFKYAHTQFYNALHLI